LEILARSKGDYLDLEALRREYGEYSIKAFQGDWMGLLRKRLVVEVEKLRIESAGGEQGAIGKGEITSRGKKYCDSNRAQVSVRICLV
jgi:hypothetical protein